MVSSGNRGIIPTPANPFTERGRITEPYRFTGRWRELSMIFERLETYRPVLVAGPPGIGKSSLLTHVTQSAALNLDDPELRAFYIDLAVLPDAAAGYELITRALGNRGNTSAALEIALLQADIPVLLCLDQAECAIEAGWGETLLESLARMARQTGREHQTTQRNAYLLLVAALRTPIPTLSEPFATLTMGAITPSEERLLIETYLDATGIQFTPMEQGQLHNVSAGHPAYLQRAAFHMFRAKIQPGYNWQAAYWEEVQTQPIPGAMLPPGVFEYGQASNSTGAYSSEFPDAAGSKRRQLEQHQLEGLGSLVMALLPLLIALVVFSISRSWVLAGGVFALGIAAVVAFERRRGTP